MSEITKRALAASLKKLLEDRALSAVTVVDIAEDCGVNRQTFYYHFRDVTALIEWIYTDGGTAAIGGMKHADSWQKGFLRVFEYVLENRTFVHRTFHSPFLESLTRFLMGETETLLAGVIAEKAAGLRVREADRGFIARFYTHAFVGLMLDWIEGGMEDRPVDLIERLSTAIEGDFDAALVRFAGHERTLPEKKR